MRVFVVVGYDLEGEVEVDGVFERKEDAERYAKKHTDWINSRNRDIGLLGRFERTEFGYRMTGCGGIKIVAKELNRVERNTEETTHGV